MSRYYPKRPHPADVLSRFLPKTMSSARREATKMTRVLIAGAFPGSMTRRHSLLQPAADENNRVITLSDGAGP